MDKLEKYNKILEAATEKNKGIETYINLDQLESLTEPLTEDYVRTSNEELTQKHKLVTTAYGFEDMLDMYNYALANTTKEEYTAKGKNYDVLDRVQRTVTRGGKKIRTTVYSDIKDTDNKIKTSSKKRQPTISQNKEYGLQLTPVILDGTDSQISTQDLQQLNALTRELTVVMETSKDNNYIELLIDPNGTPRACLGFSIGTVVELTYIATDDTVDRLALLAIHKLIELALETEKDIQTGVIEREEAIQVLIAEQYNIQFNPDTLTFQATYEDIIQAFGEDFVRLKETRE